MAPRRRDFTTKYNQEHEKVGEEKKRVDAASPFETFVPLVVGCSPVISMKLSILLREYATQDEHPQQDAYRVPTLTCSVRVLVTLSTVFRPCQRHKALARITLMFFENFSRHAEV